MQSMGCLFCEAEIKESIDLIDDIVSAGGVSDTNLRMLLDKIYIHEQAEGLQIKICIKAQFRRHADFYDEFGEITEKCFETWVSFTSAPLQALSDAHKKTGSSQMGTSGFCNVR